MQSLRLDADDVPILYRIEATSNGAPIGATTVYRLAGEIEAAAESVRAALETDGYTDVTVDYWPA